MHKDNVHKHTTSSLTLVHHALSFLAFHVDQEITCIYFLQTNKETRNSNST
jgi:hypothetical protein